MSILLGGLLIPTTLSAQFPGGVSLTMELWHNGDAYAGYPNNAGNISVPWPDARGGGRPPSTYQNNNSYEVNDNLNRRRTIRINDEWFQTPLNISTPVFSEMSVFMVYRALDAGSIDLWGNGVSNVGNGRQVSTRSITDGLNNFQLYSTAGATNNQAYIHHVDYHDGNGSTPENSFVYINGSQIGGAISTQQSQGNPGGGTAINTMLFGAKRNDRLPGQGDLEVAELIVYSGNITQAERERINTHLGIKYGLSLPHDYILADGTTIVWGQDPAYNNNIIGIAHDAGTTLNSGALRHPISKSEDPGSDFLRIRADSNLYFVPGQRALVAAHNNGSVNAQTPIDVGGFFGQGDRANRIWKVQRTGAFNSYSIAFEDNVFNNLTGMSRETAVLLVSDDPNFDANSNIQAYRLGPNSNFQEANGVAFPNTISYITIARFDAAMWVKADAPDNAYTGNFVNTLSDQLFQINNMTGRVVNAGDDLPIRRNVNSLNEDMNFNPFIDFNDGANRNYVEQPEFIGFGANSNSVFMVVKNTGNAGNSQTFLSYHTSPSSNSDDLTIRDPNDVGFRVNGGGFHDADRSANNNRPAVISNVRGNGTNGFIQVNGDANPATTNHRSNEFLRAFGNLMVGQEQDRRGSNFQDNERMDGDMAELIVFTTKLGNADAQRVNSYLAVKYGVTLAHNYQLSDGSLTWSRAANNGYNSKITGIGRDDAFQLDQRKSKSQANNNVDVLIEHPGAFNNDLMCLMWGSDNGDHDVVSNSNNNAAPPNFDIMERVWKARNYGNVGAVDIYIDIPASRVGNLLGAQLLVNMGNNNFASNAFIAYNMTRSASGQMIFENVVLPDDSYFTVGFNRDISFTNTSPTAPASFEACPSDVVRFSYSGLQSHPTRVLFNNNDGNIADVTLTGASFLSQGGTPNDREGEIQFTIPSNAATGPLTLLDGTTVRYRSSAFIVIHNPEVSFTAVANPVCANDTTPLFGAPAGGTFTGAGVIGNTTNGFFIDGPNAGWGPNHEGSRTLTIGYNYFPEYTNGNRCVTSINDQQTITIYDNRLEEFDLRFLVKTGNPARDDRQLGINSSTVSGMVPNLAVPAFNSPFSFLGTYVTPGNVFLGTIADQINPVNFRFNNNGCIGEVTDTIYVFEPLSIPGLPDTLCAGADSVSFFRDPNPSYRDTTFLIPPRTTVRRNRIVDVTTDDPQHRRAIIIRSSTPNAERYILVPDSLPANTTMVVVNVNYETSFTTLNTPPNPPTINVLPFTAVDTVFIVPRPSPDISQVIDSVYCRYDEPDTLRPIPAFETPSTTYFTLQGQDFLTGQYNLLDTLEQDTILNAGIIYSQLVPLANRNLSVRVIYTVDRYGCIDHDTVITNIVAPLEPIFFSTPPYCTSDAPDLLSVSLRPGSIIGSGTGRFVLRPGVDSAGLFSPAAAGPGDHPVTYILTDLFGCESEFTDTLFVRTPPQIDLFLDGSNTRTQFCGSATNVPMTFQLISGSIVDSVRYFGPGVIDSTLNPNSVFVDTTTGIGAGTGGTAAIRAVVTDTFGCVGVDSMIITILQAPSINLDTAFNNEPSVDVVTGIRAQHTYCRSDSAFAVFAAPFHLGPTGNIRGTFTGEGIIVIGDSVSYDPSQAVGTLDSVIYRFEDVNGCFNTDLAIIKLDTIPDVSLIGLQDNYCPNYDTVHLTGIPAPGLGQAGTGFSGPGLIGLNGVNSVLDPSLAGLGQKIYSYTFVDGNLCIGRVSDTIVVNPLPVALFGNFQNQYCTADPGDTLTSLNDQTPPSSYYFWGNIIDSAGVLVPDTAYTGPQLIYYSYTDTNACRNVDSAVIFIQPTPDLFVTGLDSSYCYNAPNDRIGVSLSARLEAGSASNFGMSATTLFFDPDDNTSGVKNFTLIYSDPVTTCADTLVSRTYVYNPPSPVDSNLLDFYCETRDTFIISGTPSWGVFVSTSNGIVDVDTNGTQGFSPARAGTGFHTVFYQAADTFYYNIGTTPIDTLVCLADTQRVVEVRPLPDPKILQPTNNQSFCSNDTLQELIPAATVDTTWQIFRDTGNAVTFIVNTVSDTTVVSGGIQIRQYLDTVYYFDPGTAGDGTHIVTYIAANIYGCVDSVSHTFIVDAYQPRSFPLDTAYCESADSVLLLGGPPGGVFTRDGDTLRGLNGAPPYFVPNPGYAFGNFLTSPQVDTVTYYAVDGACEGDTTVIVTINPVPQVSYTTPFTHNTYCLGMPAVPLTPNIMGGSFIGNGVLLDSMNFRPSLAGAGIHPVTYTFIDSATNCSNFYVDTLFVYGMPNVSFNVIGGCQSDTTHLKPDNNILGLGNFFDNRVIDSITNIQWILEPGVIITGTSDSNRVDSITYVYNTPGIYNIQLVVANQVYCVDTHTVRWVVSPTINNFPYSEGFENGDGNWFAESNSATQRLLWEWGRDTTNVGFPANATNHIWGTGLNQAYQASDNAWVYSPCFDISSLQRPMVHFDYWTHTPDQEDGTIIEYQRADGTWTGLGKVGRGINWFNSLFIAGQPGGANVRPIGWSGTQTSWKNGRYKLDDYRGPNNIVRLRFAFGAFNIQSTNYFDGFAFDNVWIGNRTRNVLLETSSNIGQSNMTTINAHIYNLVYHTNINKDLVTIQYHSRVPDATDQFHLNASNISNIRLFEYGEELPGYAFINGVHDNAPRSLNLTDQSFEQDMLQDPKFSITIDTFEHISNTFKLVARVTALVDMPSSDYRVYTVITEDSLYYQNSANYPDMLQTIVRKDDEGDNSRTRAWSRGDTERFEFIWDHSSDGFINYEPGDFKAVVFIQDKRTEEVFQAATDRDVSGYHIGVDITDPVAQNQYSELTSMVLFPNPARDAFNVRFEVPLSTDYQWRLVDIRGVEVQTGTARAGTDLLTINSNQYPSGTYVLLLYNKNVFAQRKVIIQR